MTTSTPQPVPGRRITYTHPITEQTLPGIITAIDEGNLLRLRLDGHRVTITQPNSSDRVVCLEEMGTLPVPDPAGRFTPIPEEVTGVWERVPVHQFDTGDIIAITDDQDAATAAVTGLLADAGHDPSSLDLTGLEAVWEVFEWQTDGDYPWLMFAAMEGDDQAVHLYRLPAPAGENNG